MITINQEKPEGVIHYVCSGKVTHDDYIKVVIPTVEDITKEQHALRAFCDLRNMTSIELQAILDDYKLGMKHYKDFQAFATVGDQWWMGPLMAISKPFFKMKLKHFKSADYDKALEWIKTH